MGVSGLSGLSGLSGIAPAVNATDPDVATFFAAMDAASQTYWQSEVTMLNTLVKSLKSASLWDRFTMLWVPVGQSIAGAMRAIKHPNGAGFAMANNGFTQAMWSRTSGLDGRNVTHWIGTGTLENRYDPSNDTHLMVCIEDFLPATSTILRDIGTGALGTSWQLIVRLSSSSAQSFYWSYISSQGVSSVALPSSDISGLWIGSRKDGLVNLSQNGTVHRTAPVAGSTTGSTATLDIFRSGVGSSNKRLSLSSSGKGFSAA